MITVPIFIPSVSAISRAVLPVYDELVKAEQELTTASWEMVDALLGRGFLDIPVAVAQTVPAEKG